MKLSFKNRLSLAVGTLFGSDEKVAASIMSSWESRQAVYPSPNFTSMVKNGWRKNELIFSCISKTANTAAQVELSVMGSDGSAKEDHPLKELIEHPNPYMTEFDLWASVIIYTKLAGRAIFEKERSNGGDVIRLWPLRPDWVTIIPGSQNTIAEYRFQPTGVTEPARLDPKDVLDFKVFDPFGLFQNWPPAAVASRVGDIDNTTTDYIKIFYEKGGVPPGLLKTRQRLVDSQVDVIRRRWRERYGGYEKWSEPAVLDMDAEYQKTGLSFTEMGFDVLDARNESRICMVLDVPPVLVGAKIGLDRATYANYKEARGAWWEDSLMPLYMSYQDTIETQLAPEFGSPDTGWNFTRVAAFQEARESRWKRATEALRIGGITINEFCDEVGLPDKGPAGDVYLRTAATIEVPAKTVRTSTEADTTEVGSTEGASSNGHHHEKVDIRRKQEKRMQQAIEGYLEGASSRLEESL